MKNIITVFVILVSLTTSIYSQQNSGRRPPKPQLNLTDEQSKSMYNLTQSYKKKKLKTTSLISSKRTEINVLLIDGKKELNQIKSLLPKLVSLENKQKLLNLKESHDIRTVLTARQNLIYANMPIAPLLDALQLDDDQLNKIYAIETKYKKRQLKLQKEAIVNQLNIDLLVLEDSPDFTKINSLLKKLSTTFSKSKEYNINKMLAIRTVLNSRQRQLFEQSPLYTQQF